MTAPIQTPNLPMAHAQVELTTGDGTTEICVRMIHDSDRQRPAIKLRGTITELWPRIVEAQREGYGAFFVVNAGGDTNAEINSIRACFIDADNVPLPDTWHLPPDFTVQRDEMHWHAHWRVLDVPVDRFRDLQRRLAAHYGTDPSVCNPSRVMRLAGTLHQKDKPTVVTLADMTGGELPCLLGHTVDEVARGLPEIVAPNTETPKASVANGLPITADAIEAMVRCIPPSCNRNQWLIVCGGLCNAPVSDPAFDGLALFTAFSCGDLHGVPAPDNFKGEDDCADEWQRDQSKRAGGASVPAFGALVNLAREYGYDGPSQSFSAADTFAHVTGLGESSAPEHVAPHNKFRPLFPNMYSSLPLPAYILGKILPANAVILIYGPPGSYKTFIALEFAWQIATGRASALGPVAQGAVADCAGEAPISIARKRFPAWMQHRGIENPNAVPFALVPAVPLVSTASDVDALIASLKETGLRFSLIVIDTVARALGGLDENSAKDVGLLLAAAEKLRNTFDCSVLLIHHTGKDEGRGARGSSALIGGVDAAFEVKAEAEVLAVTLRCEKMKEADPPAPIRFQGARVFNSLVFDPMPEAEFAALTRSNTSVHHLDVAAALKALDAVNGKAVTTHVLAAEMAGADAPNNVVESKRRALIRASRDRLRAYVTQLGEGRGVSTLWSFPTLDEDGGSQ